MRKPKNTPEGICRSAALHGKTLSVNDVPTRAPAARATGHPGMIRAGLATRRTRNAALQPPTGPAAPGNRRIGTAVITQHVFRPAPGAYRRVIPESIASHENQRMNAAPTESEVEL